MKRLNEYLRSSEHHPQIGSLAARHSSQLLNRSHSDNGNFVTCANTFTPINLHKLQCFKNSLKQE